MSHQSAYSRPTTIEERIMDMLTQVSVQMGNITSWMDHLEWAAIESMYDVA